MKQICQEELTGAPGEINPVALVASMADEDTMYLHELVKAPDRDKFFKAMKEEISAHSEQGHWEVVKRSSMPKNQQILKAVWSMKQKSMSEQAKYTNGRHDCVLMVAAKYKV